ncbi:MAG: flagellar biosynthetic protein FliQ [Armatimonadota bacterium]
MTVLELAKMALMVGVQVSAPMLAVSLVVGTVIGVLMAATQVQEFTLTFVPKLLAMGIIMLLVGPWMLRMLVAFATAIFGKLPAMAP